ncbi:unnamed protein product [Linum tenue]|uniref:Uncharacterized protein n=1 Tax=Linum tenue TaxID=586396 RepID=A0AAV0QCA5_9ROSI|nr:unnamed protein product [Linum tenue]
MMSCRRRLTAGSAAPLDFHRGQKDSASTVVEVVSLPLRRIRNRHLLQPAISLRAVSRRRSELFLAEAAVGGHSRGVRERPDGGNEAAAEEEELPAEPLSYSAVGNPAVEEEDDCRGDLTTHDAAPAEAGIASRFGEKNRAVEVAIAAAATVVLGVGNRVLYKLALVPLKHYPFFLAQLATVGYVLVYFTILHFRHRAGIVSNEMLSLPKGPFILVGILEALGAATGMAAAANLSGASIPVISQTFLVWQIFMSAVFLGKRYKINQLLGCFLVAIGVIITVASGSSAGHSLKEAGIFWSLLMILSFLFQAADTVLKRFANADA